ncbi:ABC transporter substrate-binding protein (plasmid) [Nocardioides sp. R1-1]|uniref:ABC transporter substrate-binding protein n=1 Tax=Nocardioides sp. R1-1 TaxID=3383502 RepID=UPI0038D05106
MSFHRFKQVFATLSVLAVFVAGACSVDDVKGESSALVSEEVKSAAAGEGEVIVVRNNWTGQMISSEVGAQVLERMGFEIEIQTLDSIAMWPAIAKADNMLQMEVWPPVQKPQMQEWIDDNGEATVVGENGYAGTEGWYVPTYVIEGDEERGIEPTCPGLPDYQALNDCVEIFATSSSGSKGRYLSGDPSWGEYYGDEQRIENLGLDYVMEFAGSEAALAAEIKRAYDRGEPILALMWFPHFITSRYDLTQIEFPPYTEECWKTTYACGWEDGPAFKVVSDEFEQRFPLAYQVVEKIEIPTDALVDMIVRVDGDGLTVEEAASEWLDDNEDTWTSWVPEVN